MNYHSQVRRERVGWNEGGMSSTTFISRVLPIFSLGLLMTAAGAYLGWELPSGLRFVAMFITLIMVFTSRLWAYQENASLNIGVFLLFTALTGITLVSLLQMAIGLGGPGLIVQALGTTVLTFGALAGYGAISKKDFTGMGTFLFLGLIGLIIASIVNIFVGGTMMMLIISAVSTVIFSLYILFEMSAIKRYYSDRDYIIASIGLYLSFINLFQDILILLGFIRKD